MKTETLSAADNSSKSNPLHLSLPQLRWLAAQIATSLWGTVDNRDAWSAARRITSAANIDKRQQSELQELVWLARRDINAARVPFGGMSAPNVEQLDRETVDRVLGENLICLVIWDNP